MAEQRTEDRTGSARLGAVRSILLRASFGLGAAGLLGGIAVDFAGVVARHVGLRVLGSIEIIQFCIVGVISASLVTATATGAHAAVHLVTARLPAIWRERLERAGELATALAFLLLLAGDVWILVDLWPLNERSDLLHLPIAPARILWCASLALAAALALSGALQLRRPATSEAVEGGA